MSDSRWELVSSEGSKFTFRELVKIKTALKGANGEPFSKELEYEIMAPVEVEAQDGETSDQALRRFLASR